LGYLATSGAKSDVIFLLGDPDFPQRWRNFAPISLSFQDLSRDRQTDRRHSDRRRQTRPPFHKTLTVCEPKNLPSVVNAALPRIRVSPWHGDATCSQIYGLGHTLNLV